MFDKSKLRTSHLSERISKFYLDIMIDPDETPRLDNIS